MYDRRGHICMKMGSLCLKGHMQDTMYEVDTSFKVERDIGKMTAPPSRWKKRSANAVAWRTQQARRCQTVRHSEDGRETHA